MSSERPSEPERVFMSYRRSDNTHFTGRFYDRLVSDFGTDHVFRDVDSILPGTDFADVIRSRLREIDVVVALIGPTWAERLHEPDDVVRMEIRESLHSEAALIPVLIEDTPLPDRTDLPEELRPLAGLNAVRVRGDPDFHKDADRVALGIRAATASARERAEKQRREEAEEQRRLAAAKAAEEQRERDEAEARRDLRRLEQRPRLGLKLALASGAAAVATVGVIIILSITGGGEPTPPTTEGAFAGQISSNAQLPLWAIDDLVPHFSGIAGADYMTEEAEGATTRNCEPFDRSNLIAERVITMTPPGTAPSHVIWTWVGLFDGDGATGYLNSFADGCQFDNGLRTTGLTSEDEGSWFSYRQTTATGQIVRVGALVTDGAVVAEATVETVEPMSAPVADIVLEDLSKAARNAIVR